MFMSANERVAMTLTTLKTKINRREIDTIIVAFPDVFGRLVGKRFTGEFFFEQVASHGTHACNYLLTVDIDMRPDFSTLRALPWQEGSALVICDFRHHDGSLVEEAPRTVLRRQLEGLAKKRLACNIASELEFYLFNHTYHEAFLADYHGLSPSSDYRIDYHTMQTLRDEPLFRSIRNLMRAAGVPVENSKGEWGRGQHEINLTYTTPVEMADNHILF